MTITEFDEQANTKRQALHNFARAYSLYSVGLETHGVMCGYQTAALSMGVTWAEIETAIARQDRVNENRND